ncbi:MAG: divalent-cation tolerance protein CutA [Candidatus Micrarchaeota archaeon]|nr:divalent-cation tolerance protein CutA [Candidatus Micrarchaeota archaeon]
MRLVLTTVSSRAQARQMASALVSARLAACVSFHPVTSLFRWKGKVKFASEYALEIKTARPAAAMAWLGKNHPYELPALYSLKPSAVHSATRAWVKEMPK